MRKLMSKKIIAMVLVGIIAMMVSASTMFAAIDLDDTSSSSTSSSSTESTSTSESIPTVQSSSDTTSTATTESTTATTTETSTATSESNTNEIPKTGSNSEIVLAVAFVVLAIVSVKAFRKYNSTIVE